MPGPVLFDAGFPAIMDFCITPTLSCNATNDGFACAAGEYCHVTDVSALGGRSCAVLP